MYYIEVIIDGEPWEIELRRNCVYTKCPKCGERIGGLYPDEFVASDTKRTEQFIVELCPNCRHEDPPEDGRAQLLRWGVREYERRTGRSITEEQLLALVETMKQERIPTPHRKVSAAKNKKREVRERLIRQVQNPSSTRNGLDDCRRFPGVKSEI